MSPVEPMERDLDPEAVVDELPDIDEEAYSDRERPVDEADRSVDPGTDELSDARNDELEQQ